ncbi:MAG: hypothetical protein N2593_01835 [Patescibacteria group bacterium]|nr:hypothetical protein [Patescibacteria group bacterium]
MKSIKEIQNKNYLIHGERIGCLGILAGGNCCCFKIFFCKK